MAKKVLLDTSFILSAIRNKIDFLEEIENLGLFPIVPVQVINELEGILKSNKLKFREEAKLALQVIDKKRLQKIDFKSQDVDRGLIDYSKKNKEVIIATLDRELKKKIKNQKLVVRAKKKLEVL